MKSLLGLPFVLIGIALYFLPAIIAYTRKYKNRMSVLVIDLFLGWTLVGWVVALALSFADDVEENEKQDEMMENVLKIGGIIIGVLIILGIIGNLIENVGTTSHSSSKQQAYYLNNSGNKDTANKNGTFLNKSSEEDNPADILFQPDKLLEFNEEERKEILSKLSNEDIVLDNKDVNARDKERRTILMYASQYCNDPAIIETLIKGGAYVNAVNNKDNALLYASHYNNNPEIIETLIMNGATVDDNILGTASSYNNNPEVVETIIAKSVKKLDIDRALRHAFIHDNNLDVIKTLVKHGGNLKQYFNGGQNAIMLMSNSSSDPKVIDFLIDKGLDIKAKDDEGKTVLMHALDNSNLEIVNVLINRGVDVNSKGSDGKTALMYASMKENIEKVNLLIKHNANVNAKDNNGKNTLMLTYEVLKNNSEIDQYLQKLNRLDDVRRLLIDNGININAADNTGKTVLMYACEFVRDTAPIEELLEKGANVNAKDKKGYSVYDYARRNKNIMFSKIKAVLDKYQK